MTSFFGNEAECCPPLAQGPPQEAPSLALSIRLGINLPMVDFDYSSTVFGMAVNMHLGVGTVTDSDGLTSATTVLEYIDIFFATFKTRHAWSAVNFNNRG